MATRWEEARGDGKVRTVLALLTLQCAAVWAHEPPPGWLEPPPEALRSALRDESPTRFVRAEGDFDGDGETDHAALFLSSDGSRERLYVRLSSADVDEWLPAADATHGSRTFAMTMGIAVAEPGPYATLCGKGYRDCRAGEPARLELQRPGIHFFQLESAASIVYWNPAAGQFSRVWTSD